MTTDNFADDPRPAHSTDPEIVRLIEGVEMSGCTPGLEDIKYLLASSDPWAQSWSRRLPQVLQRDLDAAVR